ncbi:hypothetical protein JCM12141A_52550 [Mycolicibacterium hodleri]
MSEQGNEGARRGIAKVERDRGHWLTSGQHFQRAHEACTSTPTGEIDTRLFNEPSTEGVVTDGHQQGPVSNFTGIARVDDERFGDM